MKKHSHWMGCVMGVALGVAALPAKALTIEEALAGAYDRNPQIRAEREKLQATDENVSQALSGFRPTVGANYSNGRQRTDYAHTGDKYSNAPTTGLRIEQPLFRGGATLASYKSSLERVKSGQYNLSAVEQNVMLNAASSYMNVVAGSAILDLSRKNAEVLEEQYKATDTRFEVGEVTRTDVAQSTARLSDAKSAVISAEGQLLSAMAAYERVVGVRPEGEMVTPQTLPELPLTLDEALERARAANPQLLAALHEAKASEHDVDTQAASLLPRVSLVGQLSRQGGAGTDGKTDFDQDKLTLDVTIPLYQSGAEWSRVREAKAIARQRDHETIDRRMNIDEAVTQSWESLQTSISTISARQDQIKAAEMALDGVKQEQQYGTRTVLDVLDAEQELFNARTNLVRAQRDRVIAAYNLAFSLGQLTPQNLNLNVAVYDPEAHAREVKWQPIGY